MWRVVVFFTLLTTAASHESAVYECGRMTPKGTPMVLDGAPAARGEFPWHVGVFQWTWSKTEEEKPPKLEVICGGSIISAKLVISAAHCFWDDNTQKLNDPGLFAAAAGKIYREWDSDNETIYAQHSNISELLIPELYRSSFRNWADDIALMVLESGFRFRPYLRPVCLDFDPKFEEAQLTSGSMGMVAGWGFASENGALPQELQVVALPFVTRLDCIERSPQQFREYITPDKLCAGFTNGTTICKGDSGGGLVFARKGRHYLRGVVSTKSNGNALFCNAFALATFTRISVHQEFILSLYRTSELGADTAFTLLSGTNKCSLPPYPEHGTYTVEGRPSAGPGVVLDRIVVLQVECDSGYRYVPEDAVTNAFADETGVVFCYSGSWNYKQMPTCELDCGRATPSPDGRLSPWRALVYYKVNYRCDATLVRFDVIITAVTCVVEFLNEGTTRFLDERKLTVTVGRQFSKVLKMSRPPDSDDIRGDITLLFVERFQPTPSLQPACLEPLATPAPGEYGKAVYNNTEVEVMVRNTCKKKEMKFCAMAEGQANLTQGSGLVFPVQAGSKTRYFLRGVVTSRVLRNMVFVFKRLDKLQEFFREQLARRVNQSNNFVY